jgi:hypothetical protein
MQEEREYLKIEIPVEDETPFVPEQAETSHVKERAGRLAESAGNAGKQVADTAVTTAKKAWQSDARKKVTGEVKRGASTVAGKTARVVQDKMVKTAETQAKAQYEAMQTRIQETDWKHEAQTGTARGLKWLSLKLSELAERFTPKGDAKVEDASNEQESIDSNQ